MTLKSVLYNLSTFHVEIARFDFKSLLENHAGIWGGGVRSPYLKNSSLLNVRSKFTKHGTSPTPSTEYNVERFLRKKLNDYFIGKSLKKGSNIL